VRVIFDIVTGMVYSSTEMIVIKQGSFMSLCVLFSLVFLLTGCPPGNLTGGSDGPIIQGCQIFPADNIWNVPVDHLPVDTNSDAYITTIGVSETLHPDFGSGTWDDSPIGIPFITVNESQENIPIVYTDYGDESDPGPFPIPLDAPIEGGPASDGDRHVIVIDTDFCILYELFHAFPRANHWEASSGAVYDLSSHALRPDGYTSADAAGLPILPGLLRYEEVASGKITHALRFTVAVTRDTYVWPARHMASSHSGEAYPPMGQRFRLKAGFDISGFSEENQVILTALKKYGMMIADNGSSLFLSGVPDNRWDNDDLHHLHTITAADFEAVDVSSLMKEPDSGEAVRSAMLNF
jgi:hypothetical protein